MDFYLCRNNNNNNGEKRVEKEEGLFRIDGIMKLLQVDNLLPF